MQETRLLARSVCIIMKFTSRSNQVSLQTVELRIICKSASKLETYDLIVILTDNNNGWGRRRIKFLNPRIMLLSKLTRMKNMQIRHKQMAIKKSHPTKATLPRLQSTKFIILSNNLLNNNNNSYKSNHSSRHNNNRIIYTRMFYSIKIRPSSNSRSKYLNNNTSRNSKCLTIKMATRYTYWEEKMKPIILIRS